LKSAKSNQRDVTTVRWNCNNRCDGQTGGRETAYSAL